MFSFLTVFANAQLYFLCPDSITKDGQGFSWLNYCDNNGQKLQFYKEYSDSWTYVTDYDLGDSRYAFRIPYRGQKCSDDSMDVDSEGYAWTNWCLNTGQKLEFEQKNGKFVVDHYNGEEMYEWRRPVFHKNPVFKSFLQASTEIDCIELEGDTSGRFFPIEFEENGEKIQFEKDRNGNFIVDPVSKTRITSFLGKKRGLNKELPLCRCENLFEIDPSGEFYWIILFKDSLPIAFVESQETYYFINPNTGQREVYN